MFLPLMAHLRVARPVGRSRTRPDAVRGDKAYSSRAIRAHLRSRGIKAVIPEPADQQGHRKRRGSRGGRPVGLDAADYRNRNDMDCCVRGLACGDVGGDSQAGVVVDELEDHAFAAACEDVFGRVQLPA